MAELSRPKSLTAPGPRTDAPDRPRAVGLVRFLLHAIAVISGLVALGGPYLGAVGDVENGRAVALAKYHDDPAEVSEAEAKKKDDAEACSANTRTAVVALAVSLAGLASSRR